MTYEENMKVLNYYGSWATFRCNDGYKFYWGVFGGHSKYIYTTREEATEELVNFIRNTMWSHYQRCRTK